jgi:hypothetical protein
VSVVGVLVGCVVLAGVALRVYLVASWLGTLDGDEAVTGLMARHFLHGELSTFWWSQSYGGTQEVLLTAGVFALFGSGAVALKIVPIALSAVAAVLVWRVGRRTVGEPAARIGAALFWVWPAYVIWKSTKAHGFYGATLVLGLVAFLLALRLRERDSLLDAAVLGFALGCGLWASPQIAVLGLPAVLWLLWRRPRVARLAVVALPAALLGALPWVVANVRHHGASFDTAEGGTPLSHLHSLAVVTYPTALGLRVPFSLDWLTGPLLGRALVVGSIAGLGWLAVRRQEGLEPLLVSCATFPLLYAASPWAWLTVEPRYLFMLAPVIALLLGRALRDPWRASIGLSAALALTVVSLATLDRDRLANSRVGGKPVPGDIRPLLDLLEETGTTRAVSDDWFGRRITFESKERVIVSPEQRGSRFELFTLAARETTRPAHVYLAGTSADGDAAARLERLGYRRVADGAFVVYVYPSPAEQLPASAG